MAPAYFVNFDYTCAYVDLDDTVLAGTRPNAEMMGLLYHLKNRGKKLVLITRHNARFAEPATEALRRAHIDPALFDEVLDIAKDTPKSAFIPQKDAIFIDDSHRERKDVHTTCGIPTFACEQACEMLGRTRGNF